MKLMIFDDRKDVPLQQKIADCCERFRVKYGRMRMEDWPRIGSVLENLRERGYFPAIGYDINGWEAWVFLDNPVQGELGDYIKTYGETATEAVAALQTRLAARLRIASGPCDD